MDKLFKEKKNSGKSNADRLIETVWEIENKSKNKTVPSPSDTEHLTEVEVSISETQIPTTSRLDRKR